MSQIDVVIRFDHVAAMHRLAMLDWEFAKDKSARFAGGALRADGLECGCDEEDPDECCCLIADQEQCVAQAAHWVAQAQAAATMAAAMAATLAFAPPA